MFFDHIYGSASNKAKFLKARDVALEMLAANIVLQSKEQGHEVIIEVRKIEDSCWELKCHCGFVGRIKTVG